ncbi:hypothetical protein Focb16_v006229 [Fusarium oxysporum f. sp. cubense]|uniref:Uncharacterized protein n=1 Tax=Fusarium oxysporum f. sp. cubense TaxID=61366 RepID=A0A559LI10_FUSOC|nr:hypothetical protein Focb16_v006229 [Fusarium oxysporum f. sp. cubense]
MHKSQYSPATIKLSAAVIPAGLVMGNSQEPNCATHTLPHSTNASKVNNQHQALPRSLELDDLSAMVEYLKQEVANKNNKIRQLSREQKVLEDANARLHARIQHYEDTYFKLQSQLSRIQRLLDTFPTKSSKLSKNGLPPDVDWQEPRECREKIQQYKISMMELRTSDAWRAAREKKDEVPT